MGDSDYRHFQAGLVDFELPRSDTSHSKRLDGDKPQQFHLVWVLDRTSVR